MFLDTTDFYLGGSKYKDSYFSDRVHSKKSLSSFLRSTDLYFPITKSMVYEAADHAMFHSVMRCHLESKHVLTYETPIKAPSCAVKKGSAAIFSICYELLPSNRGVCPYFMWENDRIPVGTWCVLHRVLSEKKKHYL